MPKKKIIVEDLNDEKTEVEQAAEEVVIAPVKESKQILSNGVQYLLRHERGEYKVYEKCNPDKNYPEGLKLLQVLDDNRKANNLFSTLEGLARTRRMKENHGIGNPFQS